MKTINQTKYQTKLGNEQLVIASAIAISLSFIPELALAAAPDAFATVYTKVNGWVGGSAGKLITFISVVVAGVMGVFSFPIRYILGALGTGLLLSSASALVDMIF